MKLLLLLVTILPLLLTTRLSGQPGELGGGADSLADRITGSAVGSRLFIGTTLNYPVLSWFSGAPSVPLPFIPDTISWHAFSPEQEIGFGLHGLIGYRFTTDGRLRAGLTAGLRYQKGRSYFHARGDSSGRFRPVAFGRMIFSLTTIRLGTELQYEVLSWDRPTPFPEKSPEEVLPRASVDRWYAVVLRVGATGLWRVGSNVEIAGNPGPDDLGGSVNPMQRIEGIQFSYYDDSIPELDPFGLELLGGIALEFPVGDQVTGSIGVAVSENLSAAAPDGWTYQTVEVQGGVVW